LSRRRRWFALASLAALAGCTSALGEFERTLAARDSATAALGQWCGAKALAAPPIVRAEHVAGEDLPASAAIRRLLDVDGNQPIGYRHVRLSCGARVLSVAHNWYVPGRLTQEMNRTLDTSDTPFGKVVAPLGFTRKRLASMRGAAEGCPADTVLSHRALLVLPDGKPISLVVECYTAANLS
jgi:chorismate-pyruvate lyase